MKTSLDRREFASAYFDQMRDTLEKLHGYLQKPPRTFKSVLVDILPECLDALKVHAGWLTLQESSDDPVKVDHLQYFNFKQAWNFSVNAPIDIYAQARFPFYGDLQPTLVVSFANEGKAVATEYPDELTQEYVAGRLGCYIPVGLAKDLARQKGESILLSDDKFDDILWDLTM